MIIDDSLLDGLTAQAGASGRLRMNFNFHDSPEAPSQRMLNALEVGTLVPVHRHKHTAETYILLRGKIKVMFCDECGGVIQSFLLDPTQGVYGVDIPRGQWHCLEVLEAGSVIFEAKDGPYTPLGAEDVLTGG